MNGNELREQRLIRLLPAAGKRLDSLEGRLIQRDDDGHRGRPWRRQFVSAEWLGLVPKGIAERMSCPEGMLLSLVNKAWDFLKILDSG